MDVSAAVVKLREKESNIRKFHDPVADTVLDAVGFGIHEKLNDLIESQKDEPEPVVLPHPHT